jgi:hypothetical protein
MMARLKRASQISETNITPIFIDDELIQVEIRSGTNTYLVSCNGDLWRCNCDDFVNRGVNREEGSFCCKHCLAVINFLMSHGSEEIELLILDNESNISKCSKCGNELKESYLGEGHGHVAKVLVCETCRETIGYV